MSSIDLGALLAERKHELEKIRMALAGGDHVTVATAACTLALGLAAGHPELVLLTPFASGAIATAFGSSTDAMLRRELAALETEEQRRRLIADVAAAIEAALGQALIQLVRVQHRVKEEIFEELGGLRADFSQFRNDFLERIGPESVRVDEQGEELGVIGVRVSRAARKRRYVARQELSRATLLEASAPIQV